MKIRNFLQLEKYLNRHISKNFKMIFQGDFGLKREKYFLQLLGNPQNKIKVIHIAGTSGKGSTCYLISCLLKAHGFKVGLHLSPHLTDVRERFQIDNKIISKKEIIFYLNKLIPFVDKVKHSKYGKMSYFEILVGLAYFIFSEKKVDYAVMETGLGGLYDATNVVDRPNKVAVLTKIGHDHTKILGKTLKEIAFQKAMIINKNSLAVSIYQEKEAEKAIKEVAKKKQAKLHFIDPSNSLGMTQGLGLIGEYQKENASLALETVSLLAKRDRFKVDEKKILQVFTTAHFIGRFDVKKTKGKTIILDGAHNPQKMEAFTGALKNWTKGQLSFGRKFHFLVAFKKARTIKTCFATSSP